MGKVISENNTVCYHCGEECRGERIHFHEKDFCCVGCKSVFEILEQNELCTYYSITRSPGVSQQLPRVGSYYDFLDDASVADKLIHFKDGDIFHVKFRIPGMHCSSCIWLLENLHKINTGIQSSRVTFMEKEVQVVYNSEETSLKDIVILLKKIGYEPNLSLDDLQAKQQKKESRSQIYKIGIAGFCFGNIMMLSFPDYFAGGHFLNDGMLNHVFNYVSLSLSLPVFFYCAQEFFVSSWQHIKQKRINIDVPIALAILITFCVSIYLIVFEHKLGFLDSMSGIVFFMLLGRFFQNKSYHYLSFQRSYASYLPISVNKWIAGKEVNIPLTAAAIGDQIVIRNNEVIPADALLMNDSAWFDYSFVTGESNWVEKHKNEIIYAGAMLKSSLVNLTISKSPSQSYITKLWNSRLYNKYDANTFFTAERMNLWFSAIVLFLGFTACMYWVSHGEYSVGLKSLITVWIVACPCALLLSTTFTNGNMLTILAGNGMFVKNAAVLEKLRDADTLVFDKTGTLTHSHQSEIDFIGRELKANECEAIFAVANVSIHPLSRRIAKFIDGNVALDVTDFVSQDGKGISGRVNGLHVQLGSQQWLGITTLFSNSFTRVFVAIDKEVAGYFEIRNQYRESIFPLLKSLRNQYDTHLLSGDNDAEKLHLADMFSSTDNLCFHCLPEDKTAYIKSLQSQNHTVVMIGDGLNDANAFEQSDAGIAVIEQDQNYLPACDVILKANRIHRLQQLLQFVGRTNTILYVAFVVSLLYNIIGLSFAMRGLLTPVVAAILMPVSTISIVGISFILSRYFAWKYTLSV